MRFKFKLASGLIILVGFLIILTPSIVSATIDSDYEQCCICFETADPNREYKVAGIPENGSCLGWRRDTDGALAFSCPDKPENKTCEIVQQELDLKKATKETGLPLNAPTLQILKEPLFKFSNTIKLTDPDSAGRQYYVIPWIGQAISAIYKFGISAAAVLAVVMIVVGGFIWLTSAGNQTAITTAKGYIFGAVIGLTIALGSYTLLYLVNPELIKLRGIKIPYTEYATLGEISEDGPKSYSGGWSGQNITNYDSLLSRYAGNSGVDCNKLKAHMLIESGGRPGVVSPKGACGLMQVMPTTAGKTCEQLKDPETNIAAAAKFYNQIKNNPCPDSAKYKSGKSATCDASKSGCDKNDEKYVIAAYNGGAGANCNSNSCPGQTWWECTQNSGYQETRDYVQKVQATYEVLKSKGWGCN